MARIDSFFKLMGEQKASDLHLATNNPPMLRINGELVRVDYPPLRNPVCCLTRTPDATLNESSVAHPRSAIMRSPIRR